MSLFVITAVSLLASGLTLFSGFGLGTILTPAFALFFPIELAVALTAVVHLANNLFKLALLGRHAERSVVLLFGLPAVAAAFVGATALASLSSFPILLSYSLFGRTCSIVPAKAVVAVLLLVFVCLELSARFAQVRMSSRLLPLGGILSGFFGGLSGHQGALRSAFLLKLDLSKDSYVATGVVVACLIDLTRLTVYSTRMPLSAVSAQGPLVATACAAAFLGSFLGARLLEKVTLRSVQLTVSAALIVISLALLLGVL